VTRPETNHRREQARTFLFVSALDPRAAARAVTDAPTAPQMCVIGPSARARETAAFALNGRWAFVVEEPLLTVQVPAESGDDILARLARALRNIVASDAGSVLVVVDRLDILGAGAFALDEQGLMRCADDLERLLPLP
jgi:hypothetical protein